MRVVEEELQFVAWDASGMEAGIHEQRVVYKEMQIDSVDKYSRCIDTRVLYPMIEQGKL